jgi:uncharacterized repeat protein (TIGR03833 family)
MQRPRNRQGRGTAQIDRGRGGRGRGRRRGGDRQDEYRGPSNVPNINQVVPGGFVSIVLKFDQPTGREVQGVVADVLTSGNHPCGIKVRLVDGRVGRVQRMVTEEEAKAGLDGLNGLRRDGEQGGSQFVPRPAGRMRHRDVREEEEMTPTSGYNLSDFLPLGHPLREESTTLIPPVETSGQLSTCPVCGEFEGDEVAVSHHVNSHFD